MLQCMRKIGTLKVFTSLRYMILNIFQVSLKLFMIACILASSNQLNRLDISRKLPQIHQLCNILSQQLNSFHQSFIPTKIVFLILHLFCIPNWWRAILFRIAREFFRVDSDPNLISYEKMTLKNFGYLLKKPLTS